MIVLTCPSRGDHAVGDGVGVAEPVVLEHRGDLQHVRRLLASLLHRLALQIGATQEEIKYEKKNETKKGR